MNTEPLKQPDEQAAPADGDYVPYGFGHPAHKPDPDAKYGFDLRECRPLPIDRERRWRVPG